MHLFTCILIKATEIDLLMTIPSLSLWRLNKCFISFRNTKLKCRSVIQYLTSTYPKDFYYITLMFNGAKSCFEGTIDWKWMTEVSPASPCLYENLRNWKNLGTTNSEYSFIIAPLHLVCCVKVLFLNSSCKCSSLWFRSAVWYELL